MDTFPPTYDIPSDHDDDTMYTDIHMDPRSIPVVLSPEMYAPPSPFVPSDEEMEEEEEDPEYETEEDPEEEPLPNPTSDDVMVEPNPTVEAPLEHIPTDDEPSDYVPTEDDLSDPTTPVPTPPRYTTPPVPELVRTPYYYPSRNGGTRTTLTARKRVRLPDTDIASTSRAPLPPAPLTDPYYPIPHPASSPTPSPARDTFPGNLTPIVPASPRSPNPALIDTTDPAMAALRDNAYALGNRLRQLEHRVTELPGPGFVRGLEGRVTQLDRHMDFLGAQVYALERQVADEVRELRMREGADRVEIHNLRRRLQALEDQRSGSLRR
jgi:hypothetical protein